jgi:hypothetical protein
VSPCIVPGFGLIIPNRFIMSRVASWMVGFSRPLYRSNHHRWWVMRNRIG